METPIYTFLTELLGRNDARFHMPGHKGRCPESVLSAISRYDITEIEGADALYEARGIIGASERTAALLYGAGHTSFSAGGSTLCIQAMTALVAKPGDTLIAGRNAHAAFFNACALLGVTPHFVLPRYHDAFGVSGEILAADIEQALYKMPHAKGVYITSPDYFGVLSDIQAIHAVCRAHSVPLLVDNAHGAHLRFLQQDRHPLRLGADLCCDSAHKSLPVLTGGAYLHVSEHCNISKERTKSAMALFGSTSPSYLTLLSLDLCNRYLSDKASADFIRLEKTAREIWKTAAAKGYTLLFADTDPAKITLDAYEAGMSGTKLSAFFRGKGIACEYAGIRHVLLMLSPQNTQKDFDRLQKALSALPAASPVPKEEAYLPPEAVIGIREALLGEKEQLPLTELEGKIAAETVICCPPGVPIVAAGERIDKKTLELLKTSSIFSLDVVKYSETI